MTADTLRAAIETALRRRDPYASVCTENAPNDCRTAVATVLAERTTQTYRDDEDALRALAVTVGLRVTDDGVTDPAEECERLHAELDDMNNLVSCQRDALNDLARVTAERERHAATRAEECERLRAERDESVRSRDYSRSVIASDDEALRTLRAEVAEYMERLDAIRRYVSSRDHGEGCPGEEYESDCECGLMQLRALVEVKP